MSPTTLNQPTAPKGQATAAAAKRAGMANNHRILHVKLPQLVFNRLKALVALSGMAQEEFMTLFLDEAITQTELSEGRVPVQPRG